MFILFNGLPYFGKKIVSDLQAYAPEHRFVFADTYYSFWGKLKFVCLLPFANLVVSMNGVSDCSPALDFVIRFRKKLLLYWQGTDVLLAAERTEQKTINSKYIQYGKCVSDADWLIQELATLQVPCNKLLYKWLLPKQLTTKFETVQVFSYFAKSSEDFYGWQQLRILAMQHSSIPFFIAGSDGHGLTIPENVHFLGWIDAAQMKAYYEKCPIFIRLTQHDGYALSVMEALSNGAEVIWTMPHEECFLVTAQEDLNAVFTNVLERVRNNNLQRNEQHRLFIKDTMNKEVILKQLMEGLIEYAN
jgi:hypothetical protein